MEILLYRNLEEFSAWSYYKHRKHEKLNIELDEIFDVISTSKDDILELLGDSGSVVLGNNDSNKVFEKHPELLL